MERVGKVGNWAESARSRNAEEKGGKVDFDFGVFDEEEAGEVEEVEEGVKKSTKKTSSENKMNKKHSRGGGNAPLRASSSSSSRSSPSTSSTSARPKTTPSAPSTTTNAPTTSTAQIAGAIGEDLATGIYKNVPFTFNTSAVIGTNMQVSLKLTSLKFTSKTGLL